VTAKLAYDALTTQDVVEDPVWWYQALWKVKLPYKLILFMWLFLKDRVLTGVNYKLKGGIGPYVCTLCLNEEEYTMHLFFQCSISQSIWENVYNKIKLEGSWNMPTLERNLHSWFISSPRHRVVPFIFL
jgi:hypothetical protein